MNNIFQIDEAKCVRCGTCVRDCAFKVLKTGDDGRPVMSDAAKCMRCQHCFAICPTGAVKFDGHAAEEAAETASLALPKAIETENWMRTRRSIRHFTDEDVSRESLDRVLRALANAPTGCNARGLTFTVYPDHESLARFKESFLHTIERHRDGSRLLPRWLAIPAIKLRKGGEDIFFRGASGLLIVSTDETNPALATPEQDVASAVAQFEMLANAHGISTCWCGFMRMVQNEVPELLESSAGIRPKTPFCAMLFGKASVRYPRTVIRDSYANIIYR